MSTLPRPTFCALNGRGRHYMGILGELKAGDEVVVEVMRDGKPVSVNAVMQKRK